MLWFVSLQQHTQTKSDKRNTISVMETSHSQSSGWCRLQSFWCQCYCRTSQRFYRPPLTCLWSGGFKTKDENNFTAVFTSTWRFGWMTHLMSENEAWDAGHKLSQEHQGQKHGILQEACKWNNYTATATLAVGIKESLRSLHWPVWASMGCRGTWQSSQTARR